MKTITAGGKQYELHWVNGKVEETGKNLETKVSGGGGGGATFRGYGGTAPVTIRSQTVVHDQIFLVDATGKEHSNQLQGMNVACRASNELSVIWAIKGGDKNGKYIAVHNFTTSQSFFDGGALNNIFRRSGWLVLAAVVLCLFLGSVAGFFYLLAFLVPIAWIIEGTIGAKKFKEQTNFNEFT